jgi:3-hydroxyisobutyrate dehydrogenase-like beta-hydroxyacid dehydrogenase
VRVSFVGAGQIGAPMSERLLAAGHDVTVYARRAEVREHFDRAGAHVTDSLPDAALDADIVMVAVYSDEQLAEVALGHQGLVANMPRESILASHTTGSPATIKRIAEAGAEHGVHVVDAPFSGGTDQINNGTLTVMLGGAAGDVERIGEVVRAYADPILPIGELGSALVVKLVNNALFAANIQLVAQAERVANELGVDTPTLASVIQQSSGASYVMGLVTFMGSAEHLIEAAGHYMRKDIDVVRAVAAGLGVDLGVIGEAVDGGPADFRPR